jgi:hypothetical protein
VRRQPTTGKVEPRGDAPAGRPNAGLLPGCALLPAIPARAEFIAPPHAAEERAVFGEIGVAKSRADLADGLPPSIGRECG